LNELQCVSNCGACCKIHLLVVSFSSLFIFIAIFLSVRKISLAHIAYAMAIKGKNKRKKLKLKTLGYLF